VKSFQVDQQLKSNMETEAEGLNHIQQIGMHHRLGSGLLDVMERTAEIQ